MTGMTGDVPYYGGRFTPAQAYAASHPRPAPPPAAPPPPASLPSPTEAPAGEREPHDTAGTLDALAHLRDTGVLSSAEYDELRGRVQR